jgi:hypothetical protein
MKRILISIALVAASSAAFANPANVPTVTADTTYYPCIEGATGGKSSVWGGSGTIVTAANATFTRTGFDIQCSANVILGVREVSANLAVVSSGSQKGNQFFAGHSNGGAISAVNKCGGTNNACTRTNIDSGIQDAITKSSASGT